MIEELNKEWFETVGYEITVFKAGSCRAYHEIGQKFLIEDYTTPRGICIEAFHSMYPILYAGRFKTKFTQTGSDNGNIGIFNCPSGSVQFAVLRFFQCNNCGEKVKQEELQSKVKNFDYFSIDLQVCDNCSEEMQK